MNLIDVVCLFVFLSKPNFFSGVINPVSYEYHNVHVGAQLHPQELRGDIVYGRPHHESVTEHKQSLTNENFPSDKHTQVIFKSTTAPPFHETQHQNTEIEHEQPQHPQYGTPAIQNHPTSVVYHNFEQYYNNPEPNYDQQSHDEQINEENPGIITFFLNCTYFPVRIFFFFFYF